MILVACYIMDVIFYFLKCLVIIVCGYFWKVFDCFFVTYFVVVFDFPLLLIFIILFLNERIFTLIFINNLNYMTWWLMIDFKINIPANIEIPVHFVKDSVQYSNSIVVFFLLSLSFHPDKMEIIRYEMLSLNAICICIYKSSWRWVDINDN